MVVPVREETWSAIRCTTFDVSHLFIGTETRVMAVPACAGTLSAIPSIPSMWAVTLSGL